jgi:hypothetical protein
LNRIPYHNIWGYFQKNKSETTIPRKCQGFHASHYEFPHWERGSHSSYAQTPLLDCVFCFIIRSQLDLGCSLLCGPIRTRCRRGSGGSGKRVSGQTLLLVGAARGFSLRRSQRDAYIVGLNMSGSESASRSPNDTQKNGASRSIVRMGRRTFCACHHSSYGINKIRHPCHMETTKS